MPPGLQRRWRAIATKIFPMRFRRAVRGGDFESVLDEHFWYLGMAGEGSWPDRITELEDALCLRARSVAFHQNGPGSEVTRLRCHTAIPLTEVRTAGARGRDATPDQTTDPGGTSLRPEEVRVAFNAPFWPHMLVTTSIGQGGWAFTRGAVPWPIGICVLVRLPWSKERDA
jgi:hypothetical protein